MVRIILGTWPGSTTQLVCVEAETELMACGATARGETGIALIDLRDGRDCILGLGWEA